MIAPGLFGLIVGLSSLLLGSDEAEIVFAGDAMQHDSQLAAARTKSGTYDYSACFRALKPYIASADYAVVNLETPLGGRNFTGYPMFCSPDAYAEALKKAGFDLALTANNHILDRGDAGLRRTVVTLDSLKLTHIGTYRNATERTERLPLVKDINGFAVGFLNYTYGTNGLTPGPVVKVDYIDTALIRRDIETARRAGAEIITVCLHWGVEYRLLPEPSQRRLADAIHRLGADIVMGGHPHVIQPMELKKGDDGQNQLTVYSLGNFLSGMRTSDTRGGAMASVKLKRDSLGRAYIDDASYRLVFTLTPLPGSGDNVRVIPAELHAPDRLREQQRAEFVRRAENVYNQHNIGVSRDTIPVAEVARQRALARRHYLMSNDED